jgi:hypothetical protein
VVKSVQDWVRHYSAWSVETKTILTRRENTKLRTIQLRRQLHLQAEATTSTQIDQILS